MDEARRGICTKEQAAWRAFAIQLRKTTAFSYTAPAVNFKKDSQPQAYDNNLLYYYKSSKTLRASL